MRGQGSPRSAHEEAGVPALEHLTPLTLPSDFRHKELAPLKYLALEEKLHKDPRLVEFLKIFV